MTDCSPEPVRVSRGTRIMILEVTKNVRIMNLSGSHQSDGADSVLGRHKHPDIDGVYCERYSALSELGHVLIGGKTVALTRSTERGVHSCTYVTRI